MNATYTTKGSIRGSCGHQHRSVRTAVECVAMDQAACKSQHGYSDRRVVNGDGSELDDQDFQTKLYLEGFYN